MLYVTNVVSMHCRRKYLLSAGVIMCMLKTRMYWHVVGAVGGACIPECDCSSVCIDESFTVSALPPSIDEHGSSLGFPYETISSCLFSAALYSGEVSATLLASALPSCVGESVSRIQKDEGCSCWPS